MSVTDPSPGLIPLGTDDIPPPPPPLEELQAPVNALEEQGDKDDGDGIDWENMNDAERRKMLEYKDLFDYFDEDGSGAIDEYEADEDGSGEIDFPEFVEVMKNATENIFSKKELVDAFTAMDLDGGGTIQATELLNMSQETMDAKHLQMLLREADEDGDGEISLEEYLAVMGCTVDEDDKASSATLRQTSVPDLGVGVGTELGRRSSSTSSVANNKFVEKLRHK